MSNIYRCACGQQFKADIPAGGAKVKCPGCGKLLQLGGVAAAAPARAPAPTPSPAPPGSSDPLFGDLPSSPSPSFGGGAPLGAPAGQPFPRRPGPAARPASQPATGSGKGSSSKVLLYVLGGLLAVVFLLGIVGAIAGLGDRDRRGAPGRPAGVGRAGGGSSAPVARSSKPVTREEAEALARKFEKEIQSGSPMVANNMVDWRGVVDRGMEGFDIRASQKEQFARGAVQGLRGRNWAQVVRRETNGNIALLRMRTKDGAPTALFRANTNDGGVGYFELAFYRNANDQVGISDVYAFQTGEWMSATIHRAAIPFVAHLNRSFLDRLSGAESDYVKHQSKITQMGTQAGTVPRAAMATYRSLPATLKGDKTIMILRIGIASKLNDDNEYQSAINDFMNKFPNDPAAQLFAIDYYVMKEDMPAALRALDKLDQQVGGDPALQVIKAAVIAQQGDLAKANQILDKALEMDPDYQEAKDMKAQLQ